MNSVVLHEEPNDREDRTCSMPDGADWDIANPPTSQ